MTDWYKPIKVVNRGKVLQTFAKSRDRDAPLPRIRGAKLIDMSVWKFPRVGSRIKFLDRIETVYTTKDIIRIFDIDKTTVYKWQKSGLLPEPLFTRQNKYDKTMRYYVRPQLAVAAKVVNDLRRQGLLKFHADKIKHHVAMVKKGNEIAVRAWHKKREGSKSKKSTVTWLEDE